MYAPPSVLMLAGVVLDAECRALRRLPNREHAGVEGQETRRVAGLLTFDAMLPAAPRYGRPGRTSTRGLLCSSLRCTVFRWFQSDYHLPSHGQTTFPSAVETHWVLLRTLFIRAPFLSIEFSTVHPDKALFDEEDKWVSDKEWIQLSFVAIHRDQFATEPTDDDIRNIALGPSGSTDQTSFHPTNHSYRRSIRNKHVLPHNYTTNYR